uniref:Phosphate transport system permease protein PstA n=1 Tax=uncultured Armatimonadetes bacterium TaxID=157466 RepID=A0A6J4JZM8_9BACT|nr:Phosphate transport system permease protein PstA [uncultured Armatimonadetes bacterium]
MAVSTRTDLHLARRRTTNFVMLGFCVLASIVALVMLGLVLYFLASQGLKHISPRLFTRLPNNIDIKQGGIAHSIFGTLTLLGIASLISLPLGILGGIYQVEARGRFAFAVRFLTDVLNGIPSIVIGIFVYAAYVYPLSQRNPGSGFSGYAGGLALGIMMIPLVMRTTEEILRLVPFSLREASLGLGATRWRTMWSIVLPVARGGVITGIMLALARVAGETAPLLFTILGNEYFPTKQANVLGAKVTVPAMNTAIDALPLRIFNYAVGPNLEQHDIAWAAALILIAMILIFSIAARYATRGGVLEEH